MRWCGSQSISRYYRDSWHGCSSHRCLVACQTMIYQELAFRWHRVCVPSTYYCPFIGFRLNATPFMTRPILMLWWSFAPLKSNTGNSFSHRANEYTYLVHPFVGPAFDCAGKLFTVWHQAWLRWIHWCTDTRYAKHSFSLKSQIVAAPN